MHVGEDFLEELPSDPVEAVKNICKFVIRIGDDEYEQLLEGVAVLDAYIEANALNFKAKRPDLKGSIEVDIYNFQNYVKTLESECRERSSGLVYEAARARFAAQLGKGFFYEFTQGDVARIQDILNELRSLIGSASTLEEDHRRRVLLKLENLQAELHKKVSDLDRFWGIIGEMGVVTGRFGNDVKPLVDRVKELAQIIWRTQSRAGDLPSGTEPPLIVSTPEDPE